MPTKVTKTKKVVNRKSKKKTSKVKTTKTSKKKVMNQSKTKRKTKAPKKRMGTAPSVQTHLFQNDDWYVPKVGPDSSGEFRTDWLGTRTGFGK
jgi:hypothetical protein